MYLSASDAAETLDFAGHETNERNSPDLQQRSLRKPRLSLQKRGTLAR
jgi:hypothetical protein